MTSKSISTIKATLRNTEVKETANAVAGVERTLLNSTNVKAVGKATPVTAIRTDKKISSFNKTLLNAEVKEPAPVTVRNIELDVLQNSQPPVSIDQPSIDLGNHVVEDEVTSIVEEPQIDNTDETLELQLIAPELEEVETEVVEASQQTQSKDWKAMLLEHKYMILGTVAAAVVLYVILKK